MYENQYRLYYRRAKSRFPKIIDGLKIIKGFQSIERASLKTCLQHIYLRAVVYVSDGHISSWCVLYEKHYTCSSLQFGDKPHDIQTVFV